MTNNIRHGDLVFTFVNSIPLKAKPSKDNVLALGEFTGHSHVLERTAKVFDFEGYKFLEVETPAKLTHQEHKTLIIPKGKWRMHFEREFDPFTEEIKKVQD